VRRTIADVLADAQSRLRRVTPSEAWDAMRHGWLLVDTRSSDDRRDRGVVPGSVHVPLSVLEWRVDPTSGSSAPELAGREDRLILLCADGCSSSLAAIRLHEIGFTSTTDVIGGFTSWLEQGLPVTDAQGASDTRSTIDASAKGFLQSPRPSEG
jgi:rhodanese-related sulfurtransferase